MVSAFLLCMSEMTNFRTDPLSCCRLTEIHCELKFWRKFRLAPEYYKVYRVQQNENVIVFETIVGSIRS